ncbi:putative late blight resistance protein homolog R1B-17 [Cornus florida]|uniref:putative late blight resistance protein homolog R1B-17 n=1 Tax=Cornus florida TaxID=4283 RepID=UPI00289A8C1A|nr:putative late blight resistance protein homolog R1B-17 [Cornus florida]
MTVKATVEFLLEKMMQLINSDDQLILEAYENKLIDQDQIESLYQDMQFLGKFLRDSEEKLNEHEQLKLLVSRIRYVTCEVEETIDSLVLNSVLDKDARVFTDKLHIFVSLSCKMVDLAEKINCCFKTMMQEIDLVKYLRTELINLLSWFESQLAEKNGDIGEDVKATKIYAMKCFETETGWTRAPQNEMRKRLIITWFESDMPDEIRFLFKLSEMMVYRSRKIRDCFRRRHVYLCEADQDMIFACVDLESRIIWSEFDIADDIHLLLSLSQEMSDLLEGLSCSYFTPRVLLMEKKVMTIYEKASSLDSHMADEFLRRLKLLEQMVSTYLPDPLRGLCMIDSMKTDINFYERELTLTWLHCSADKIRHGFGNVTKCIKSIKTEVRQIYEEKLCGIGIQQFGKSSHQTSPAPISPMVQEETVVGLDEETENIKELLTEEHEKQLKCIAIIGMPGLGKTTLAKKVYNDCLIQYHFYICAWIYVSQVYKKEVLLHAVFSSAFQSRDDVRNLSDEKLTGEDLGKKKLTEEEYNEKLGEKLYKRLKGNRYLIIMDDIWNSEPWNDLKRYFPNDSNGSRILFTTRHEDVAVALHAKPHRLRFLNEDESWDLLRLKTFLKESCPLNLMEIGKKIARKTRGLPLAIVVISGLLAKQDKTLEWWKHVAKSVSSYMVSDPEQYMHTLELSYNHLPHYLKPCFLYLGAFIEDHEIPVQKLIWLWVAEGFIWKNEQKTLEEVAVNYLMDLIDRSLVIVSKKRSNGEIKACRVHDLLRDLCLSKAQEENFLHQISIEGHKENLLERICDKVQEEKFFEQIFEKHDEENIFQQIFGSSSSTTLNKHRRMCIHPDHVNFTSLKHYPYASKVCSIVSFGHSNTWGNFYPRNVSLIDQDFILLRVLDLSSIQIPFFPGGIHYLVLLRYLALHVERQKIFLPSKFNLLNLETLFLEGQNLLVLSDDIWKKVKLRHLCVEWGIEFSSIPNDGDAFLLANLQTLGKLHLYSGEERALKWIPNLIKLKCDIRKRLNGDDHFPKLNFLIHLETLNVLSRDCKRFFHLDNFPPSLRSLTLSYVGLSWEEMSILGMLPNLEVLKLLDEAFEGSRWDTSDGEFRKLRFLKFRGLDVGQWNASSNHFPCLQQLVLEECVRLEEIPSSLGDIPTLEMIQLRRCSCSAENSVREIQEQQRRMGNNGLKIQILEWNHGRMF